MNETVPGGGVEPPLRLCSGGVCNLCDGISCDYLYGSKRRASPGLYSLRFHCITKAVKSGEFGDKLIALGFPVARLALLVMTGLAFTAKTAKRVAVSVEVMRVQFQHPSTTFTAASE